MLLRLAAAATVMAAGCGGPQGNLALGWRFADGRSCADASVTQVAMTGPIECCAGDGGGGCASTCRFACSDGSGGRQVTLAVTGAGTLALAGQSPAGASLYRGQAAITSLAAEQVILYFTAGR